MPKSCEQQVRLCARYFTGREDKRTAIGSLSLHWLNDLSQQAGLTRLRNELPDSPRACSTMGSEWQPTGRFQTERYDSGSCSNLPCWGLPFCSPLRRRSIVNKRCFTFLDPSQTCCSHVVCHFGGSAQGANEHSFVPRRAASSVCFQATQIACNDINILAPPIQYPGICITPAQPLPCHLPLWLALWSLHCCSSR